MDNKQTILAASGISKLNQVLGKFDGYEVLSSVDKRSELFEACKYFMPNILLVGETLKGKDSLTEILFKIAKELPNIRIVYLTGAIDMNDETRVNALGYLVLSGVYDIIHEKKLNVAMIKDVLDNPKTYEDVSFLTKNIKTQEEFEEDLIEFEVPDENDKEDVFNRLKVISSIKPGTGKSFISVNTATGIAAYGEPKPDGTKPKVALIEADLQNLSIGTLLQIEDDKKNLKTAMDAISKIIDDEGRLIGDESEIEKTNLQIIDCFKPHYKIKNLYALTGSQLTFEEVESIKDFHYAYLINAIIDEFDVVIIDSNSSLNHASSLPVFQMASNIYYVLNLDFNNIRNNVRYKSTLKNFNLLDKVKYVLNEDIKADSTLSSHTGQEVEELIFTADHLDDSDFPLTARIPVIPKTVFLNRLYDGAPIVLDNKDYTREAKYEILKICNEIWPIEEFEAFEKMIKGNEVPKKKKKGLFR